MRAYRPASPGSVWWRPDSKGSHHPMEVWRHRRRALPGVHAYACSSIHKLTVWEVAGHPCYHSRITNWRNGRQFTIICCNTIYLNIHWLVVIYLFCCLLTQCFTCHLNDYFRSRKWSTLTSWMNMPTHLRTSTLVTAVWEQQEAKLEQ
jgi:hypothetical protein